MSTGAPAAWGGTPTPAVTGVGIDTTDLASVRQSLARHGERYLRFVLSQAERAEMDGADADPVLDLATRWAAKEAVTKVLVPSPDDPWPWRHLEILGLAAEPCPEPTVRLSGRPHELARARGVARIVLRAGPSLPGRAVTMTATGLAAPTTPDEREQAP